MTEVVKPPRSQDELNKKYTDLCTIMGDRIHKQDLIQLEINRIKQDIDEIDAESRALAKQKAEIEAHNLEVQSKKTKKKAKV